MIQMVVENAHKAGIWAGICGELGADQELTKEFLAMGVDETFRFSGKHPSAPQDHSGNKRGRI